MLLVWGTTGTNEVTMAINLGGGSMEIHPSSHNICVCLNFFQLKVQKKSSIENNTLFITGIICSASSMEQTMERAEKPNRHPIALLISGLLGSENPQLKMLEGLNIHTT